MVQFAFVLYTMAKEEKVKEERGRGLPLSLQSLQGGSTVDSGNSLYTSLPNWTSRFLPSLPQYH